MADPVTDFPAFFEGAKAALSEVQSLRSEEERLKSEEAKSRADLESEQKALKDNIDLTLKKRVGEINSTYDREIEKGKEELKRVRNRRERAKNAGVKERIREETKDLIAESASMKKEMREAFRKQHVPGFCASKLYYTLFMPHRFGQFVFLLFLAAVFFAAVPCGIYFLAVPAAYRITPVLVVIYFADILIVGGLYMTIGNVTKNRNMEMLRSGRDIWDQIGENRRMVKRVTRRIRQDKAEDKYNLGSFDDQIAQLTQNINEASVKKQEALNEFETSKKDIITDELTAGVRPRIEQLTSEHAVSLRRMQEVAAERQQKTLLMADRYEVYLGKEFMTEDKLNTLQQILESGRASSISDAIRIFKNGRD